MKRISYQKLNCVALHNERSELLLIGQKPGNSFFSVWILIDKIEFLQKQIMPNTEQSMNGDERARAPQLLGCTYTPICRELKAARCTQTTWGCILNIMWMINKLILKSKKNAYYTHFYRSSWGICMYIHFICADGSNSSWNRCLYALALSGCILSTMRMGGIK